MTDEMAGNREPGSWERETQLPVGVVIDDGGDLTTISDVTLRKMTGREEALLTDPKLKNNSGALITALLASCVTAADGVDKVTPKLLRQMTSADRNYLLLELRRLTFGDEIESQYRCPSCSGDSFLIEDLSEIEVERLEGGADQEVTVAIDDGYQGPDGEWHVELTFRFPRGDDEEAAAGRRDKNLVRQQDALLTRCLTKVGTLEPRRVRALGTQLLAALSMADRRKIQRTLDDGAPGPNLIRTITCDQCGTDYQSTLDMRQFFPLG